MVTGLSNYRASAAKLTSEAIRYARPLKRNEKVSSLSSSRLLSTLSQLPGCAVKSYKMMTAVLQATNFVSSSTYSISDSGLIGLSGSSSGLGGGGGSSSSPKVQGPPSQHHFRHFNHKAASSENAPNSSSSMTPMGSGSNHKHHTSAASSGLFSPPHAAQTPAPVRGATIYTRPRSASIGNRLSDAEQGDVEGHGHHRGGGGGHEDQHHHAHYHHHYRHRRHHTLDGHQHGGHGGHFEDIEVMAEHGGGHPMISFGTMPTTSSRSVSSKSEKSSSRSSQSPSVENIRHGKFSSDTQIFFTQGKDILSL